MKTFNIAVLACRLFGWYFIAGGAISILGNCVVTIWNDPFFVSSIHERNAVFLILPLAELIAGYVIVKYAIPIARRLTKDLTE
jgi:hypothetical protein